MVQVDLPGAFAAGQIFAILSKKYLRKEEDKFTHRMMGPVGWYFALIYAPIGMFLLYGWPAWECMYWWEWVEQPAFNPPVAFFYISFYLAMILIGNISYIIGHSLYQNGKDRTVNILAVIGVIATLLPFILWPFTWYRVGTYAQYHAIPKGTTTMFNTPSFFYSWLCVMGYFTTATVFFGFWLKRYSERLAGQ
ncbi:MAG: hypothetical protein ACC630_06115 [Nitrospinota bacterium]